jgi:hypothetical protein
MSTLVITILFPWLDRRFGTLPIYRCAIGLDVLFVTLYPVVHALAVSTAVQLPHDQGEIPLNDGMWSDVALPVLVGIGIMLTVKAFSIITSGHVCVRFSSSRPTDLLAMNTIRAELL